MTTIIITLTIALLAGLAYAAMKTNEHCIQKYRYKPFGIAPTAYMSLPCVLFAVAVLLLQGDYAVPQDRADAELNAYVLLGLVVVSVCVFCYYLSKKTSMGIAVFAALVQAVFAAVIIAVVLAVLFLLSNKPKSKSKE